MQSVINTVKGTALGVAGYLTPVLKVGSNVFISVPEPIVYHCANKLYLLNGRLLCPIIVPIQYHWQM